MAKKHASCQHGFVMWGGCRIHRLVGPRESISLAILVDFGALSLSLSLPPLHRTKLPNILICHFMMHQLNQYFNE